MRLNQLPKTIKRSAKRIGRGLGSGKGKTGGRGTKGQKARGKVRQGFIGGTLPLYRKLPFRRGKGNRRVSEKSLALNISVLQKFKKGVVVDLQSLLDLKLIKEIPMGGVKILGSTKLEQPLTVRLPVSSNAKKAIEKAGGKVENA